MARLIDANALVDWLTKPTGFISNCDDCPDTDCVHCIIMDAINNAPTVDAVEVVRCKDCKHSVWDEENEMWKCTESADYDEDAGEWFGFYEYHNGDFFCADGERKDK